MLRRLSREVRAALELVLLPGLAAILPWHWCFAVFKRLARLPWLYRDACESALQQARCRGWAGQDEAHWLWVRRLTTLVDHADHYLALTRGDSWMLRHLDVSGAWPQPGRAAVLCAFHWGAGLWGLRHAAAHGLQAHALVAKLDPGAFRGQSVMFAYVGARIRHVSKILRSPALDVSASLRPAMRALRVGEPIFAVVDVPADQVSASIPITLLGMPARVPRALMRLAVDQSIPVTVCVAGINMQTGQRFLRIKDFGVHSDLNALVRVVYGELEALIAEDAPAWHFWGIADRFFTV